MPNDSFQACLDTELPSPKLKLNIQLTKSPKHDHIINCVYACLENISA